MSKRMTLKAWLTLLILGFAVSLSAEAELKVEITQNSKVIPIYDVLEITFHHEGRYENPFFDVTIEVTFTSPGGKKVHVGGFFYGSSEKPRIKVYRKNGRRKVEYIFGKHDLWKARFAPWELGRWRYTYTFSNVKGERVTGEGGFTYVEDAFPLEPEEWQDKDGDLIGDNLDADDNGDGIGDDENHNGIPDYQEMDFDGDGVPRARAVPWDAFPFDPKEWRDTDGDGIGDNADVDDDGDGWSDDEERRAGTDPLNRLSFPQTKDH
ncbi:DUF5060 domain-containing protein [Candidatus Poribacteria bacterium]|nr:DUF5060 domain-containing protein [Candidatus Poribacteria bacterium]